MESFINGFIFFMDTFPTVSRRDFAISLTVSKCYLRDGLFLDTFHTVSRRDFVISSTVSKCYLKESQTLKYFY